MDQVKHDLMHDGMYKWTKNTIIKGIDCINKESL